MTVRNTSREAYQNIQGKIGPQQKIILDFISSNKAGFTRMEINDGLRLGINVVCGRVKELLESHNLEEAPKNRVCTITGEVVHVVRRPIGPKQVKKAIGIAKVIRHNTITIDNVGTTCVDIKLSNGSICTRVTRAEFDRDIDAAIKEGISDRSDRTIPGENIQVKHLAIYDLYHTRTKNVQNRLNL